MNTFDLLEKKRKHIRQYSDKIPDKEIIDRVLWKAWKTSPSKNNAMAYQVNVWGPEKKDEKIKIHSLCVKNHKDAEDRAVEKGLAQKTQMGAENPFYEHIKYNPYLFTIHSRLSKPNKFYERKIKTGHFFDQQYESYIERIVDSVSVEVGLFAQNLTNYLLEEGLDMSYNSCFKRIPEMWQDLGLPIEHRPILMITCGYGQMYRRDYLKLTTQGPDDDKKPEYNDIVKWI